jgi:hypothetical protein
MAELFWMQNVERGILVLYLLLFVIQKPYLVGYDVYEPYLHMLSQYL